jgi:hypothetical protein
MKFQEGEGSTPPEHRENKQPGHNEANTGMGGREARRGSESDEGWGLDYDTRRAQIKPGSGSAGKRESHDSGAKGSSGGGRDTRTDRRTTAQSETGKEPHIDPSIKDRPGYKEGVKATAADIRNASATEPRNGFDAITKAFGSKFTAGEAADEVTGEKGRQPHEVSDHRNKVRDEIEKDARELLAAEERRKKDAEKVMGKGVQEKKPWHDREGRKRQKLEQDRDSDVLEQREKELAEQMIEAGGRTKPTQAMEPGKSYPITPETPEQSAASEAYRKAQAELDRIQRYRHTGSTKELPDSANGSNEGVRGAMDDRKQKLFAAVRERKADADKS